MNLSHLKNGIQNIKENTPQIYKDSINISASLFFLKNTMYDEGNKILSDVYNMNQTHLDVLSTLYYLGDEQYTLSPTELYERMLFSSGGMTKVLKQLEEKEYIQRIENSVDKRSKLVQLSQLGKETTVKALGEILELEDTYYSKLNNEEQKNLQALLEKMLS
ncbi:MarR family winged helix-turn-helix transcriptional regulator [Poseidonibacter lekithochrous]|uniref:MarR family winged helix-turn-helix transcriptional regulator n=1 Tax=Poseidonibacter lekithochrous TaxID=1904463 RepID=UPI0008FCCFE5|nr:MarR family transcriptional regulator [Poseidonibacter lekithochrous]QKJ22825.1 transcriptional regulator, MarR family [Poseidonibacter lekithochrous]